jgi:hypothetical protein
MSSAADNSVDPWVSSGLPRRQQFFMKRYFEVLDAEPEKGAKDWANTFADDGKFVNGTRIIEGSKGVWCNQLSPRDLPLIENKLSNKNDTNTGEDGQICTMS